MIAVGVGIWLIVASARSTPALKKFKIDYEMKVNIISTNNFIWASTE